MKKSDLPQVCLTCRKLKAAELGKFRRGARYSQWVWECHACLDRPPPPPPNQSPIEAEVRAAVISEKEKFKQEFNLAGFSFDFAIPKLGLLIEADSATWHTRQFHRARDKRKTAAAEAAGWKVVRIVGDARAAAVAAIVSRRSELGH